jgi:hypothetical protein
LSLGNESKEGDFRLLRFGCEMTNDVLATIAGHGDQSNGVAAPAASESRRGGQRCFIGIMAFLLCGPFKAERVDVFL